MNCARCKENIAVLHGHLEVFYFAKPKRTLYLCDVCLEKVQKLIYHPDCYDEVIK